MAIDPTKQFYYPFCEPPDAPTSSASDRMPTAPPFLGLKMRGAATCCTMLIPPERIARLVGAIGTAPTATAPEINKRDRKGNTPLMRACNEGDSQGALSLIRLGAKVNLNNTKGFTALLFAAEEGLVDVLQALLAKGARINAIDERGNTALIYACLNSKSVAALTLITASARVDMKNAYKETALHFAATKGLLAVIDDIIKAGADINALDDDHDTPLMDACKYGQLAAALALIRACARVDIKNVSGASPLHYAAGTGLVDVINSLIPRGCDLDAVNEDGDTPLIYACRHSQEAAALQLIEARARIDNANENNKTAFHYAAENGLVNVLRALIAKVATIDAVDEDENTPLILACSRGHQACALVLIDAGAEVTIKNDYEETALHLAAETGLVAVIDALLLRKADIDAVDDQGDTPLICACCHSKSTAALALLKAHARMNIKNQDGKTAILYAAMNGLIAVVNDLVRREADIDAADRAGTNALIETITHNQIHIATLLLEARANVNCINARGETPFLLTCRSGNKELAAQIVRAGLDTRRTDLFLNTPLHYAFQIGATEVGHLIVTEYPEALYSLNFFGATPFHSLLNSSHWQRDPESVKPLLKTLLGLLLKEKEINDCTLRLEATGIDGFYEYLTEQIPLMEKRRVIEVLKLTARFHLLPLISALSNYFRGEDVRPYLTRAMEECATAGSFLEKYTAHHTLTAAPLKARLSHEAHAYRQAFLGLFEHFQSEQNRALRHFCTKWHMEVEALSPEPQRDLEEASLSEAFSSLSLSSASAAATHIDAAERALTPRREALRGYFVKSLLPIALNMQRDMLLFNYAHQLGFSLTENGSTEIGFVSWPKLLEELNADPSENEAAIERLEERQAQLMKLQTERFLSMKRDIERAPLETAFNVIKKIITTIKQEIRVFTSYSKAIEQQANWAQAERGARKKAPHTMDPKYASLLHDDVYCEKGICAGATITLIQELLYKNLQATMQPVGKARFYQMIHDLHPGSDILPPSVWKRAKLQAHDLLSEEESLSPGSFIDNLETYIRRVETADSAHFYIGIGNSDEVYGHAFYCSLRPPFAIQDINTAGFKFTTDNLRQFKLYLHYLFSRYSYDRVDELIHVKKL